MTENTFDMSCSGIFRSGRLILEPLNSNTKMKENSYGIDRTVA